MPSSTATGGSELVWPPPPPYSSASAIVGGTVTGQHLLKIEGHSYTKEKLPTGKSIKSRSFKVGDHQCRINYYPNGNGSDEADDFVSVFQCLAAGQPVKARATFSLLDRAGKPVPAYTNVGKFREFAVGGGSFGYRMFIEREILEKSEIFRDDSFAIRCDVTVVRELRTEDRTPPVVEVPPSDLHRHLGGLLESTDGADVTFHVAGEEVRAHRYVLAARSPVFKAELFGQMKESRSSSCSNTVVNVNDMEAEVFRALLAFIYAVMATDGFVHLMQSCPSLVKELVFRVADRHLQ